MIKFYFGYDPDKYNVTMFGKIDESNFTKNKEHLCFPRFEKGVDYKQFKQKMNQAVATVIIGDKIYKKQSDLAQRIYESILSNVVTFIDSSYDFEKRTYRDPLLRDFCYVSSASDIISRLEKLKDNAFRKKIVDLQIEDTKIDINLYCKGLYEILKREF